MSGDTWRDTWVLIAAAAYVLTLAALSALFIHGIFAGSLS